MTLSRRKEFSFRHDIPRLVAILFVMTFPSVYLAACGSDPEQHDRTTLPNGLDDNGTDSVAPPYPTETNAFELLTNETLSIGTSILGVNYTMHLTARANGEIEATINYVDNSLEDLTFTGNPEIGPLTLRLHPILTKDTAFIPVITINRTVEDTYSMSIELFFEQLVQDPGT